MTSGRNHEEEYRCQSEGRICCSSVEAPVMGGERRGDVVRYRVVATRTGEEHCENETVCIAKRVVWEAYRHVKANRGAAGIDGESIEMFEANLKGICTGYGIG